MKSIFLFLFNVVRNISLVLVILFFCFAVYLKKHPAEAQKILEQDTEMAFSSAATEREDMVSSQGIEIIETNKSTRKLAIPVKGGDAYLRPSQIMYVDQGILKTTSLQEISVSTPLYQLFAKFRENGDDFFFQTKSSIINCHYVQQLISRNDTNKADTYNYKYYAIMEDGKEISISKEMTKDLKALLNKINI